MGGGHLEARHTRAALDAAEHRDHAVTLDQQPGILGSALRIAAVIQRDERDSSTADAAARVHAVEVQLGARGDAASVLAEPAGERDRLTDEYSAFVGCESEDGQRRCTKGCDVLTQW